jgi:hypothetical protein
MRKILLIGAALLTGCPASVTAEGMDDGFGAAWGSAWVHIDYGKEENDTIVIANFGDVCTKMTAWYEATSALEEPSTDVLSQAYCEHLEEPFMEWVDASEAIFFGGASTVSVSVGDNLEADSYDLEDDVTGSVTTVDDPIWEDLRDDFDPDGSLGDNCGLGSRDFDLVDSWTLKDGTMDVTALSEEGSAGGTIDGRMQENKQNGDKSDFSASFSAPWCEIDI